MSVVLWFILNSPGVASRPMLKMRRDVSAKAKSWGPRPPRQAGKRRLGPESRAAPGLAARAKVEEQNLSKRRHPAYLAGARLRDEMSGEARCLYFVFAV
jgi:hypothetical protein